MGSMPPWFYLLAKQLPEQTTRGGLLAKFLKETVGGACSSNPGNNFGQAERVSFQNRLANFGSLICNVQVIK